MNLTFEQWKEFLKEDIDDLFWDEEEQEAEENSTDYLLDIFTVLLKKE